MAIAVGVLFILLGLGIRDVARRIGEVARRSPAAAEGGRSIGVGTGRPGVEARVEGIVVGAPVACPDPPSASGGCSARARCWWGLAGRGHTVRSERALGYLTGPTTRTWTLHRPELS